MKPIEILEYFCRIYNLGKPIYTENSVKIGFKEFNLDGKQNSVFK